MQNTTSPYITIISLSCALLFLVGCDSLVSYQPVAPEVDQLLKSEAAPQKQEKNSSANPSDKPIQPVTDSQQKQVEFYTGNGAFVGHSHYQQDDPQASSSENKKGDITLNFQDTSIHEVVKVILGDLLKKNYTIDPSISGSVNIQTSEPFHRDDLLTVLDGLLQMSNATLIEADGIVRVIPTSTAMIDSLPPGIGNSIRSSGNGFHTQIIPLRYVGAEEINKIMQPFLKETVAQIYPQRNLIILSGAKSDLKRLVETIHIFDVDWLKGMSLALVPVEHASATEIVTEMDEIFGRASNSPVAELVRFIAMDRLNSIIIITQQPRYLKQMSHWIQRLDRSDGIAGQQLYVYHVQNKRADELAEILNNIFADQKNKATSAAQLAPGLEPTILESDAGASNDPTNNGDQAVNDQTTRQTEQSANRSPAPPVTAGEGTLLPNADSVKVIADDSNNSLVILASPSNYQMVENALYKLDVKSLQVLIEASIIEVTLTDELSYGIEWFFKNKAGGNKTGLGTLDLGTAGLNALTPGFSYGIVDTAGAIRAVFNTLASQTEVNVLSSPSLMVLDNHTATLNIGSQVPITTSSSQSTLDNAQVINQIEYRDTGVLMTVTPRVNASGVIIMEVKQEVTGVQVTETSGIDSPTFTQRSIESTISVVNGSSIVLGGLIEDSRTKNKAGLPGLHTLPVIGNLFGQTGNALDRTELVVILTPRIVRNDHDAWEVTNEFKQKLENLQDSMQKQP